MAKNDLLILDEKIRNFTESLSIDQATTGYLFELFVSEQVLKDFQPRTSDLEACCTDGKHDGGIDAIFLSVDGILIFDVDELRERESPDITIYILSAKMKAGYTQSVISNINSSLTELFDFTIESSKFKQVFNELILKQRDLIRSVYLKTAENDPNISFRIIYATRGDTASVTESARGMAEIVEKTVSGLFGNICVSFSFLGASELLGLSRKKPKEKFRIKYIENTISTNENNYVILCKISDFYELITNDSGEILSYIFEDNVRDFLGDMYINKEILGTLDDEIGETRPDFWWLNNGITIVASKARIVGKEIIASNIQIVNGLQTSFSIHDHFSKSAEQMQEIENRSVLVKILVEDDSEIRDRIIRATNAQNAVSSASLRAMDKVQRDIDDYLYPRGWYYDRRANYYKNRGENRNRIVSPAVLGAMMKVIVKKQPVVKSQLKLKLLSTKRSYTHLFSEHIPLPLYHSAVEIIGSVRKYAPVSLDSENSILRRKSNVRANYVFIIGYIIICLKFRSLKWKTDDAKVFAGEPPTKEQVLEAVDFLKRVAKEEYNRRQSGGVKHRGILNLVNVSLAAEFS